MFDADLRGRCTVCDERLFVSAKPKPSCAFHACAVEVFIFARPTDPAALISTLNASLDDPVQLHVILKAIERSLEPKDESSHAMLRLLPQIIKSKHKDIAGPCLSIMATQAASRDTLQYLSEGGAIQSLIFVLREGVPEFQASACRALAGLVSDSHDRTFQFLIGEGLPPLLNLIGADKPGQLHSLALLARLLPCASKDAAERIAANPDLLALFKEVCTANVRGVPIAVASMAVVVLRVLAKVGSCLQQTTLNALATLICNLSERLGHHPEPLHSHVCDALREWTQHRPELAGAELAYHCSEPIVRLLRRSKQEPSTAEPTLAIVENILLLGGVSSKIRHEASRKFISDGILDALVDLMDSPIAQRASELVVRLGPTHAEMAALGAKSNDYLKKQRDVSVYGTPVNVLATVLLGAADPKESLLRAAAQVGSDIKSKFETDMVRSAAADQAEAHLVTTLREVNIDIQRRHTDLLKNKAAGLSSDERQGYESTIQRLNESLVQKSNIVDLLTRELNELRSTCASQSDTSTPPTKRRKIAEAESELEALKQAVAKLRNDNTELQREFDRYREEAGSELSKIKAEIVDTAKYVTGLLSSQPPSKDTPWGTGQIKEQVAKYSTKVNALITDSQSQVKTLLAKVESDEQEIQRITKDYTTMLTNLEAAKAGTDEIAERYNSMKRKMASSSEKRVQEDNARLKNRLHTAEADINKKRRIIADLEKKVAELEKKVSTVSIEAAKPQAHSANTYISAELSQDDEDLPDLDL